MLVLSRSEGRGIYFGKTGWLLVERIFATGSVKISITIDQRIAVSIGGVSEHTHMLAQAAAEKLPAGVRARHEFVLVENMAVRIGNAGMIMLTEVVHTKHVRFGFDLPSTEAVTRDDYSIEWHMEQQLLREARRPRARA